ncbi:aspartic peptidase domain-containing protein [Echria macrotheca]|uniref:Aspartic peptidase domain-containing protein n=1 Tax=Echria macrotheca TaxID=438768 RepID=A0AAJ0B926_9PEZI|nr:aspartic peptidase domain-containing protein [Echria macrotheca]
MRSFLSAAALLRVAVALVDDGVIQQDGIIRFPVTARAGNTVFGRHSKRQTEVDSTGQLSGTLYTIPITLGTPGQTVPVQIDTGSSELWVNPICSQANDPAFCAAQPRFTLSTTLVDYGVQGSYTYGSGYADWEYVGDYVRIGSATLTQQIFGVAYSTAYADTGILGLGPDQSGWTSPYPLVIDSLAQQGIINSRAFSMDLRGTDSATGSVIFGGIDANKYSGSLFKLPIVPAAQSPDGYTRFYVSLTGISVNQPDGTVVPVYTAPTGSSGQAFLLGSGSTLCALPTAIFNPLVAAFPSATYVASADLYVVDCADPGDGGSIDFTFGDGNVINVRYYDFIWRDDDNAVCILGAHEETTGLPVLGDTFLRAAYVVFDWDNRNIHMAQSDDCGTSLVAIGTGPDAVPSVTGGCAPPATTTTTTSDPTTTTTTDPATTTTTTDPATTTTTTDSTTTTTDSATTTTTDPTSTTTTTTASTTTTATADDDDWCWEDPETTTSTTAMSTTTTSTTSTTDPATTTTTATDDDGDWCEEETDPVTLPTSTTTTWPTTWPSGSETWPTSIPTSIPTTWPTSIPTTWPTSIPTTAPHPTTTPPSWPTGSWPTTRPPRETLTHTLTQTHTIHSCPASVKNCHVGAVTTEIATAYVTACPQTSAVYTFHPKTSCGSGKICTSDVVFTVRPVAPGGWGGQAVPVPTAPAGAGGKGWSGSAGNGGNGGGEWGVPAVGGGGGNGWAAPTGAGTPAGGAQPGSGSGSGWGPSGQGQSGQGQGWQSVPSVAVPAPAPTGTGASWAPSAGVGAGAGVPAAAPSAGGLVTVPVPVPVGSGHRGNETAWSKPTGVVTTAGAGRVVMSVAVAVVVGAMGLLM